MATEIISNNIENELLEQFEKADKAKDYDRMKVTPTINYPHLITRNLMKS
jgi:hypothetical protein